MPVPPEKIPTRAERERAERLAREAQALRDNLYRRKQQSRARQDPTTAAQTDPSVNTDTPGDC